MPPGCSPAAGIYQRDQELDLTGEGDNTVMMRQAARALVEAWPASPLSAQRLEPLKAGWAQRGGASLAGLLALLRWRQHALTQHIFEEAKHERSRMPGAPRAARSSPHWWLKWRSNSAPCMRPCTSARTSARARIQQ